MAQKLQGIIPALATPLQEDGHPDEAGLRQLVQFQIDNGVRGLFVCGSTGEGPMLADEDWRQAHIWAVREAAGRVPVLANVSEASTARALYRARQAADFGADAVVATLPYYYAHAGEEAKRFYLALADGSPLPVYIYNVPQRTQVPLTAEMLQELAQHPNIRGVKDSANDPILHFELIQSFRHTDFAVLNGSEFFLGASVLLGGDGGLLGICNVCPKLCVELYEAARRGDLEAVRRLQASLSDVTSLFFAKGGSPLAALKTALHLLGICQPYVSHPFLPASSEQKIAVQDILQRNGLL